jgi:superfamily II RNA helicase
LQHYVYPTGSDDILLVVDEKGNFRDDNFNRALSQISSTSNISKEDVNRLGNKNLLNLLDSKSQNSQEKQAKNEEEDIKRINAFITGLAISNAARITSLSGKSLNVIGVGLLKLLWSTPGSLPISISK